MITVVLAFFGGVAATILALLIYENKTGVTRDMSVEEFVNGVYYENRQKCETEQLKK